MTIRVTIGNGPAIIAALAAQLARIVGLEAASTALAARAAALETGSVSKAGDIMSGRLNMGGHPIEAVGTPDTDDDAVSRGYMNSMVFAAIVSALAQITGGNTPANLSTILQIVQALNSDPNFGANVVAALNANAADIGTQTGRIDAAVAAIADIVRVEGIDAANLEQGIRVQAARIDAAVAAIADIVRVEGIDVANLELSIRDHDARAQGAEAALADRVHSLEQSGLPPASLNGQDASQTMVTVNGVTQTLASFLMHTVSDS